MNQLTLFTGFNTGETDYIAQLNNNFTAIVSFFNALAAQVTGQVANSGQAVPTGLQYIWDRLGLIGFGSYSFTPGSGTSITVSAGAFWNGSTFLAKTTPTVISLAGLAAGTLYLCLDAAGNPGVFSTPQTTTIRQFNWDGTGTTSNESLYSGIAVLLSGADYAAMLQSVARNKTYNDVADRLNDIEEQPPYTLTEAGTVTIDWRQGKLQQLTLTENTTFAFTNGIDGKSYILALTQDSTGGRGVTFGPEVRLGNLAVALSGPNKTDYLGFIYRAGPGKWDLVSLAQDY